MTVLDGEGPLVCRREESDLRFFLTVDRHLTATHIISPTALVKYLQKDLPSPSFESDPVI